MKIQDYLSIVNKKIFRTKKNIYLFLLFIICGLFLLLSLSFKNNFINIINNTLSQNKGFSSLSVTVKADVDDLGKKELENINHVVSVYSSKYDVLPVESNIKDNKRDGYIDLLYGESHNLPSIVNGKSIKNDDTGYAICPKDFYPSSRAYNLFINKNDFLDGNKLIGTKFEAIYYTYKYNGRSLVKDQKFTKNFEIVGTYDSKLTMDSPNSCYISVQDMVSIKDSTTSENGNTHYNFVVVVDNIKNIDKVKQEILNNGFLNATVRNELDSKTIDTILLAINLLICAIFFAIVVIAVAYVKKKQVYDYKFNGVLRTCGFTQKQILKIAILEQLLINLITFFISSTIYIIIYLAIKYVFLKNIISSIITLSMSINEFIYTFIIMVILTVIVDILYIKRNMKKNIVNMVRS